jgi:hypothetical protein
LWIEAGVVYHDVQPAERPDDPLGALRATTDLHRGRVEPPNHVAATRFLQSYLRWRNANARHPDVLAAQRRERAKSAANANDHGDNTPTTPPEQPGQPVRSQH